MEGPCFIFLGLLYRTTFLPCRTDCMCTSPTQGIRGSPCWQRQSIFGERRHVDVDAFAKRFKCFLFTAETRTYLPTYTLKNTIDLFSLVTRPDKVCASFAAQRCDGRPSGKKTFETVGQGVIRRDTVAVSTTTASSGFRPSSGVPLGDVVERGGWRRLRGVLFLAGGFARLASLIEAIIRWRRCTAATAAAVRSAPASAFVDD